MFPLHTGSSLVTSRIWVRDYTGSGNGGGGGGGV